MKKSEIKLAFVRDIESTKHVIKNQKEKTEREIKKKIEKAILLAENSKTLLFELIPWLRDWRFKRPLVALKFKFEHKSYLDTTKILQHLGKRGRSNRVEVSFNFSSKKQILKVKERL